MLGRNVVSTIETSSCYDISYSFQKSHQPRHIIHSMKKTISFFKEKRECRYYQKMNILLKKNQECPILYSVHNWFHLGFESPVSHCDLRLRFVEFDFFAEALLLHAYVSMYVQSLFVTWEYRVLFLQTSFLMHVNRKSSAVQLF